MVKITNGINVFEVTRGAFDGIYSRQGYKIMDDENKVLQTNADPEKTPEELFVEEIIEKPISQWSKDEVKRFAAIKEIDITGTKSANEAKAIIKEFIEADSQE